MLSIAFYTLSKKTLTFSMSSRIVLYVLLDFTNSIKNIYFYYYLLLFIFYFFIVVDIFFKALKLLYRDLLEARFQLLDISYFFISRLY